VKVLRINLHIRSDISPKLYEALSRLPPRPRAEFLRKIADCGLQVAASSTHVAPMRTDDSMSANQPITTNSVPDNFSNDLVGLLGNDLDR
jgi:hypothetical protein